VGFTASPNVSTPQWQRPAKRIAAFFDTQPLHDVRGSALICRGVPPWAPLGRDIYFNVGTPEEEGRPRRDAPTN